MPQTPGRVEGTRARVQAGSEAAPDIFHERHRFRDDLPPLRRPTAGSRQASLNTLPPSGTRGATAGPSNTRARPNALGPDDDEAPNFSGEASRANAAVREGNTVASSLDAASYDHRQARGVASPPLSARDRTQLADQLNQPSPETSEGLTPPSPPSRGFIPQDPKRGFRASRDWPPSPTLQASQPAMERELNLARQQLDAVRREEADRSGGRSVDEDDGLWAVDAHNVYAELQ
ncbi:MAG: hypothetical protein L6R38_007725 [Xanthoria sp. 2 TBL-2021]|nr:MAG: hypothetical protein L6R38_007725 [Xanthoria sp. 2 TBL-2021]